MWGEELAGEEVAAVPAQQTGERKIRVIDPGSPTSDGEIRELAIKQIERRRRFKMHAFSSALIGGARTEFDSLRCGATRSINGTHWGSHWWHHWGRHCAIGMHV